MARKLTRSIILTVVLLFLAEHLLLFLSLWAVRGDLSRFLVFTPVQALVHGAILTFVLLRRKDFYLIHQEHRLERVNVANVLTLLRICTAPTILFLLVIAREHPELAPLVIVVTGVTFLTDLLDGTISRRTRQITRIGQYLDSTSDYGILLAVSIAFRIFDLISAWFFAAVLLRLLSHGFAMVLLWLYRGKLKVRLSFLGKVSIFATMTLYGIALAARVPAVEDLVGQVVDVLEIVVALILAVSLVEKVVLVVRDARRVTESRRTGEPERD
jgi:phosphatidylglycerophosphate synthase